MSYELVELCAGTASVSLWALGRCRPLTGFMGSKRRWAGQIVESLEVDRPERVVLVDAGPWGDVWSVLQASDARAEVAAILDGWDAEDETPHGLWRRMVDLEPPANAPERVAQYLWLQARSAGTIPIWWSGTRWESPSGSRTETAHQRGGCAASSRGTGAAHDRGAGVMGVRHRRRTADVGPAYESGGLTRGARGGRSVGKPDHPQARGIQYPSTIARRIRALDHIDWSRVEVVHGDVRSVEPIPGATVYHDPPYLGCPRYAELLPRADVLALAQRWADAGCRVAVSEAEPLPIEGWTARQLARREWLTASWRARWPEQLSLWNAAM
ncbi:MAG: hypothetical protein KC656_23445 [Myxococcales bacterium]|nr:hypothetical protein [Myxococcales bacterium]